MAEEEYFDFSVSEPVRVEGQGLKLGHWRYRVDTKTNAAAYGKGEYGSYRRYNDFAWLRKRLTEENPGCVVPPLPEKDMSENVDRLLGHGGVQESTLHKFRQRALRKFLVRVGAHPVLSKSASLREFVELDEEQFLRRKKAGSDVPSVLNESRSGKFKFGVEKIQTRLTRDMQVARHGVQGQVGADLLADLPPEKRKWREVAKYMRLLESTMRGLNERFGTLGTHHKSLANSSKQCARAFEGIDQLEQKHGMHNMWGDIAKSLTHQAVVYEEQSENDQTQLAESLQYYCGLCKSVQEVTDYIEDVWIQQSVLASDLESAKKKRQKASNADSQGNVDDKIKRLIERREEVEKHFDHITDQLTQDLARFTLEKQHDVKTLLQMNVDLAREFAGKVGFIWNGLNEQLGGVLQTADE